MLKISIWDILLEAGVVRGSIKWNGNDLVIKRISSCPITSQMDLYPFQRRSLSWCFELACKIITRKCLKVESNSGKYSWNESSDSSFYNNGNFPTLVAPNQCRHHLRIPSKFCHFMSQPTFKSPQSVYFEIPAIELSQWLCAFIWAHKIIISTLAMVTFSEILFSSSKVIFFTFLNTTQKKLH